MIPKAIQKREEVKFPVTAVRLKHKQLSAYAVQRLQSYSSCLFGICSSAIMFKLRFNSVICLSHLRCLKHGTSISFKRIIITIFWTSTIRVAATGILLALVTAVPLGMWIGLSRRVSDWLFPTMELFRPIPLIAYLPAAMLRFSTIESSIIFITFTGAFFPILLCSREAVRRVSDSLVQAAHCLGSADLRNRYNGECICRLCFQRYSRVYPLESALLGWVSLQGK